MPARNSARVPLIVECNIERVVGHGAVALDANVCADGLWRTEQQQGLIDQVGAEIKEHTTTRFRTLAPGPGAKLRPEAIKARLEKDRFAQLLIVLKVLKCEEVAVPAAVVIDG